MVEKSRTMNKRNNEGLLYIKLVVKKCFSGLFLIGDGIGLVALVVGFQIAQIPLYASGFVFLIILALSSYSVWKDQLVQSEQHRLSLHKIQDKIPHYTIQLTDIRKYDVMRAIDETKEEISSIEEKLKKEKSDINKPGSVAASAILMPATRRAISSIGEQLKTATQFMDGHNFGPNIDESDKEKVDRLKKYLPELEQYNNSINTVYRLSWSIVSNRYDENIKIKMESADSTRIVLEDDYIENKMPSTSPTNSYNSFNDMFRLSPVVATIPTFTNSSVSSDGSTASGSIKNINSQQPTNIFDDEMYIISSKNKIQTEFTVYSQRRTDPQHISVPVDLNTAQSISLPLKAHR